MSTGTVLTDSKMFTNVTFVDRKKDAQLEVLYDKIEYDWGSRTLIYMRHGRLVATAPMKSQEVLS